MQGKCIVVMGVSGSGKSTVARILADKMNAAFIEGDNLHPSENIAKMEHNIPLTDEDRKGWLDTIHTLIKQITMENKNCVVACSALKRKYRAVLRDDIDSILFIYLKGSFDLIHGWLLKRQKHFMPVELLKSQFQTLEEPTLQEKDAITIPLNENINEEMGNIFEALKTRQFS